MVEADPVVRQLRCKALVEGEKRFEQILLVQREASLEQPLGRIVVREKDVVYVNPDARFETRQHVEKLVTNVAAKLHCVTRVDKENVVRVESREEVDVDLFDWGSN